MASCIRSLVLGGIYALCAIRFIEAFPNFCIFLPSLPLHGKFKMRGAFVMRIKCMDINTDLPVNAAGDGGVLICDPNEQQLTELPMEYSPVCLTRKNPSEVYIPVRLSYTTDDCSPTNINSVKTALTQLQSSNLKLLTTLCGTHISCDYTTPKVECTPNYNFIQKGGSKQLDATFEIYAQYQKEMSIDFYLTVLEQIRKSNFATNQGFNGTAHLWSIQGNNFVHAEITAWTASCDAHNYTTGSNLAIHGVASCRGCPEDTVHVKGRICESCPYNHYTYGPFAHLCVACPSEVTWGALKEDWIRRCYERV